MLNIIEHYSAVSFLYILLQGNTIGVCVLPGSDVNSMDSVDSGCTMGAMDSQSNTNNMGSNTEHIIWEIEVPKVSEDASRLRTSLTVRIGYKS